MANWFIIQSLQSYSEHPDWIGCAVKEETEDPIRGIFRRIRRGDKVVYYATGDKVVVGIFEVASNEMEIIRGDKYWSDPIAIHRLKQYAMPPDGQYLDFKKFLFSKENSFDLFPITSLSMQSAFVKATRQSPNLWKEREVFPSISFC